MFQLGHKNFKKILWLGSARAGFMSSAFWLGSARAGKKPARPTPNLDRLGDEFQFSKFYIFRERDFEDKPFEDEDLPTGFDSDNSDDVDDENNWSDWRGNLSGAVCFFCPANYTDLKDLLNHMNVIHEFDYEEMKQDLQLTFYQQIKLINYIRYDFT